MKTLRLIALFTFAFLITQNADAQNDKWWQKLFKKKGNTEQNDQPDYTQPEVIEVEPTIDSAATSTPDLQPETPDFEVPTSPGTVRLDLESGIAELDREYRNNPPNVRGYRVQIFFGDLTPAREKRARFISNNPGTKCYLHQAAPNFGVRVGNFRDMESAYRMLLKLQGSYPSALIVQDKIEG